MNVCDYTIIKSLMNIGNKYRSGSNSLNCTWNNGLVPNRKRSTSRLYIVTLLI